MKKKKKTKTKIHKISQLLSTMFHTLKLLYNILLSILWATFLSMYILHSQAIIHPLISYLIDLFQIYYYLNGLFLRFKINKFILMLLGLINFFFFHILDQIGLLLRFYIFFFFLFVLFKKIKILLRISYSNLFQLDLKKIYIYI